MTQPLYVPGLPGLRTAKTAVHRIVFRQGDWTSVLAGGRIIDGDLSRDVGNTGDLGVLRAGKLMGKVTTGGKYRPAVIGLTTAAYTSGATSLTVPAAVATEVARLRTLAGGNITLRVVGPPSAAGTVAEISTTCSAASGTTLTITDLAANMISGAIVAPGDGAHTPVAVIPDGYGVNVFDTDNATALDVPYPNLPIAGVIDSTQVIDWPSDTSLRAWIAEKMNLYGKYVFDHGL